MRIRSARTLVFTRECGQIVAYNYLANSAFVCSHDLLAFLALLDDWTVLEDVPSLAPSIPADELKPTVDALIALQVAFCVLVLFAAGLFVATFDRLSKQPTGFSAERILNLETVTQRPQPPVFWDQVADHLRGVVGVETVALIGWPLMSGESRVGFISINGAPPNEVLSDFLSVSPGWAATMKIPFIDGRDFRGDQATH